MSQRPVSLKWPYGPAVTGILLLVAAYAGAGWVLSTLLDARDQFSLLLYSKPVVEVTIVLFLLFLGWRVWSLIIFQRPQHLTRTLIADVRARVFTREKLLAALPLLIAYMVFMSVFSSMKVMIPLVQPYVWDETFAQLDRFLHFGADPWRLLWPVLGYKWPSAIINVIYNLWFVVMFGVLYWQLFDLRNLALRMRFFWSYFLCFIINGSVLAMLLSSAGPCFYYYVAGGDNPFAEQMAMLRGWAEDAPIWAVATQDNLWQTYQANGLGIGSGISAMPSVHVSIAFLMVLLARHYKKAARWFFNVFAAIILVGSIHLGWHYAVDGYLSVVTTAMIWFATGKLFRNENLDR